MPISQILLFPYTFKASLDMNDDIHCIELLAARDVLFPDAKLVEGIKPGYDDQSTYDFKEHLPISSAKLNAKYDAIFLASQYCSADMLAKYPEQADWLETAKHLLNNFAGQIFIIEQDPRPKYTRLYDEWPRATVLTTHAGYADKLWPLRTIDIGFGYRTAQLNHGPRFPKLAKPTISTVFAANSYDPERHAMLRRYLPNNGKDCYTIGKCPEYGLPSLNNFQMAGLYKLRDVYEQSAFQLVLYSQHHIERGFWQTTRLFQAMSWGTVCLLPQEYIGFVPLPAEFFVNGPGDVLDRVARRDEMLVLQRKEYMKMLNQAL